MNQRLAIGLGAVLAGLGVAAGAIGTHVLKERLQLAPAQLETFDVAVRYQIIHALGLILVGLLAPRFGGRLLSVAGWAFVLGAVLFSGGIYAWLATGTKAFVHVVPLGGTAWILGWFILAGAAALPSRPKASGD